MPYQISNISFNYGNKKVIDDFSLTIDPGKFYGIIGPNGSGKTTIIEKLIPELKKNKYKIGTIKHAFHHDIDIDQKGKDSWRHRRAGADAAMIAARDMVALVKKSYHYTLDGLETYFQDMDIIITEGFKGEDKPKIEVFRSGVHKTPVCLNDSQLVALVSDTEFNTEVPIFGLEEIKGLAEFIEKRFILNQ